MTQSLRKQALPTAKAPHLSPGRPGRSLSGLACAVITAVCVLISPTAWADTESFDLSGFDGISAAEGIHVQVTSGEAFEVTAESEDARQLEFLSLDIRRGILRAQMDNKLLSPNWVSGDKVTIRVVMPSLIHVEALAGAEIVADEMSGPELKMASSSGSKLQIGAIDGDIMSMQVSSGAEVKVAGGTCISLSADVSGGSSLDMEKVVCSEAEIDASSGSEVSVHADKSINAHASSGARIRVYGGHEEIKTEVSGGGKVEFP